MATYVPYIVFGHGIENPAERYTPLDAITQVMFYTPPGHILAMEPPATVVADLCRYPLGHLPDVYEIVGSTSIPSLVTVTRSASTSQYLLGPDASGMDFGARCCMCNKKLFDFPQTGELILLSDIVDVYIQDHHSKTHPSDIAAVHYLACRSGVAPATDDSPVTYLFADRSKLVTNVRDATAYRDKIIQHSPEPTRTGQAVHEKLMAVFASKQAQAASLRGLFNRAGVPMFPGLKAFSILLYCGRRVAIPGSDGQCGPHDGPQCSDCEYSQQALSGSALPPASPPPPPPPSPPVSPPPPSPVRAEERQAAGVPPASWRTLPHGSKMAAFLNCNAENRVVQWPGPLNGDSSVGCGINALTFLGLLSMTEGTQLQVQIASQGGTSFGTIMKYILNKLHIEGTLAEAVFPVNSEGDVHNILFEINANMFPDQCIIVRLNRASGAGHAIVFSKTDVLRTIDPHINARPVIYPAAPTADIARTTFKAWSKDHSAQYPGITPYVSLSIMVILPPTGDRRGGAYSIEQLNKIPKPPVIYIK